MSSLESQATASPADDPTSGWLLHCESFRKGGAVPSCSSYCPSSPSSSSSSSSSSSCSSSCCSFSLPSRTSQPQPSTWWWQSQFPNRRPPLRRRKGSRPRLRSCPSPLPLSLLTFASTTITCCSAIACKAAPECTDEGEVVIRAWAAMDGRYQRVCNPSDRWASDCTFDCDGNLAELRYLAAHFSTVDEGVLAGVGGLLVHTTDAGEHWSTISTDSPADFYGVHATPSGSIWVVGKGSTLGRGQLEAQGGPTSTSTATSDLVRATTSTTTTMTTTSTTTYVWAWTWNEGLTQDALSADSSQALYGVYFNGEDLGWAVGTSGRTYRTTDGGQTWKLRTWENGQTHYSVHFADSQVGLIAGSNGRALWSSTGGVTWVLGETNTNATLRGAACLNGTHGFVVGDGGSLLRTNDAGKTWMAANASVILPTMHFRTVAFADQNIGFAVGRTETGLGLAASTQDGGVTWEVDHRTGLLMQTLHAVAAAKLEVPRCSDGPTLTTTTTTENAAANDMVDAQYEVLTLVGDNESSSARSSAQRTAGIVMAQRVMASSMVEGGEITVRGEGISSTLAPISVKLKRALFDELGMNETIVVISEYREGSTDWDPDAVAQSYMESADGIEAIHGQPASVNLAINGAIASVYNLANPIQITILDERPSGYMCAFWNTTSKKWSAAGVTQVTDPEAPDALVCSTTHLTTFAAVLKEVVTGISDSFFCTSVEVFSSRGWEATGNGLTCNGKRCLLARPYFWAFVVFLAFQVFLYRRARQQHETWLLVGMWKPASFLVEIPSFKVKRRGWCRKVKESKQRLVAFFQDFRYNGSVLAARTCILSKASRKLGISSDDLEALLEWAQKTVEHTARLHRRVLKQQIIAAQSKRKKKAKITTVGITIESEMVKGEAILETSRNSKLLGFVPTIYDCLDQEAAEYFEALQVGKRTRIWSFVSHIAVAGNPWAKLGYFCIAVDAPDQLLLLTGQIIVSVTAAAMWLRGDSVDDLADNRCKSAAQIGRMLGDALGITIATLLLATVPRIIFGRLCRRKFLYREAWSDDDIDDQVWRWRVKSALAFFLYGLFMFVGVLYCTSLLANVSAYDGLKWFFNFLWSIVVLSLYPLLCGLVAVVVSIWTAAHFLANGFQNDVRTSLRLKVKGSPAAPEDEEAGRLSGVEEASPMTLGTPTSSLPSPATSFSSPASAGASPSPPGKQPRQRLTGPATRAAQDATPAPGAATPTPSSSQRQQQRQQQQQHTPLPAASSGFSTTGKLRQAGAADHLSTPPLSPSAGWSPSGGSQDPLPSRQFPEAVPPVDLARMGMSSSNSNTNSNANVKAPVVH